MSFVLPRIVRAVTPLAVISLATLSAAHATLNTPANILRIEANLAVDDPAELLALVDDGKAAGATAIMISDAKFTRWGVGEANDRWRDRMLELANGIRDRELDFGMNTSVIGFCNGLLAADPNLAAGYPINHQPLVVRQNQLQPKSTAELLNGNFEQGSNHVVDNVRFQDAPGIRTFIDTNVRFRGNASFRADARDGEMSRIGARIDVQPNRQYTLSVWLRTERLTARNLQVVINDANSDKRLATQFPSIPGDGDRRHYLRQVQDFTTDWTELRLPFNSQSAREVSVVLAVFGGESGSAWWDDMRVLDTPTLNWLRRDGLPQSLIDAQGNSLVEGIDVSRIQDSRLGAITYPGTFDTYHEPDAIEILPGSRLQEGDEVRLSGYHTQVASRAQVGCSWNDPQIAELITELHSRLSTTFAPDFIHYNNSEVRTGGAEPLDLVHENSGAAFADSTRDHIDRIIAVSGDASILVWADMFDPNHNAKEHYYQIHNSMVGSWEGLDANKVIVVNWWSGEKLRTLAPASVAFFAERGFGQIAAGYYEEDVTSNRTAWEQALAGQPGVSGSMFYTNLDGYQDLAEFGARWWSNDDGETPAGECRVR